MCGDEVGEIIASGILHGGLVADHQFSEMVEGGGESVFFPVSFCLPALSLYIPGVII